MPIDVVIFHHALGLTAGLRALGDRVAEGSVRVTLPDLFDGTTFGSIDGGVAHAESVGFGEIADLGAQAAAAIEGDGPLVVVGISLGALPAMKTAQTNPRVVGAFFVDGIVPVDYFAETWPADTALEIHAMSNDSWFAEDLPVAEQLVAGHGAKLVLRDGAGHLCLDPDAPDHDPAVAAAIEIDLVNFVERLSQRSN